MNVSVLRLSFAIFWLLIGLGLFFRHQLAPDAANGQLGSCTLDMGALLALAFAVWNFVRWYMATRRRPASEPARLPPHRRPLEPRDGEHMEEYIPEFDFTKPPPRTGPEA
jgi:hypothetical protein